MSKVYARGEHGPVGKLGIYTLLVVFLLLFSFPVFWMVSTSLKSMTEIHQIPQSWIPSDFLWQNYVEVFKMAPFGTYLWNTIWYTGITVIGTALTSSLVAYAFARLRARGSQFLFGVVLSTMMLPQQVVMIPQYLLFNKLGWTDSYLPLVVPSFGASAFSIFLLRQFYLGIPRDMDEAVKIDGGGYFPIYCKIILPLSVPALATVGILEYMFRWNDLMGPLIYVHSTDKYPLALGLANLTAEQGATPWNVLMAASVMAVSIPLLLFFLAQKYFIKGIAITASKG
ncbi:MAG: carbohydrate ABC transporter permease [Novibacillus thermophilus]